MNPRIEDHIRRLAAEAGYVACGFTSAEPFAAFASALDDRIRRFPDAAGQYEGMRDRIDPRLHAPWARSVVVCIRWYGRYKLVGNLDKHIGRNYLYDRRNPRCPDHQRREAMQEGLKQLGLRVKPGGVPERLAAVRAGLGRFGRNCFVYVGSYGSWVNVESWRVDAELEPGTPSEGLACPQGCTKCIEACPTGALAAPLSMRLDHCIAFLTYSAPEPVDPALWSRMGCWVYGCDRCQEVCPLNVGTWEERETAPWLEDTAAYLTPEALADMTQATLEQVVHPAFGHIALDNAERWRRNARRALGRSQAEEPSAG